jgi:hypothetical protein
VDEDDLALAAALVFDADLLVFLLFRLHLHRVLGGADIDAGEQRTRERCADSGRAVAAG